MNPFQSRITVVGLGAALLITAATTGAVASGLVGSAGIKDNSVRSVDVRDGTLQLRDLRSEVQALIKQAGPAGPAGPTGPAGPAGPAGASIALTVQLVGPVSTIAGNSGNYVFVGPPAQVTTTETHRRVTGTANASLGVEAGSSPQYSDVGFCYRPAAGGTLVNFAGSSFQQDYFTAQRAVHAASMTTALPVGTWDVGMCLRNNGSASIKNNNAVNGWVQVTS